MKDTRLSLAALLKQAKRYIKERKKAQERLEQETKQAEKRAAKTRRDETAAKQKVASAAKKAKRPKAAEAPTSNPYGKPYTNRPGPSREQRFMQRGLILSTLVRLEAESEVQSVCEAVVAGVSIPNSTTCGTDPKGMRQGHGANARTPLR